MTPRPSLKGDENALKALWREVFGDTDEYIDAFFQNVYQPSMASVIEEDGTVVAAAYAVPFGAVRYIFAVATRPEYRGRGYGGRWCSPLREANRRISARRARRFGAGTRSRCAPERYPTAQACRFRLFAGRSRRRNSRARREVWLDGIPHAKYSDGILKLFSVTGEFFCGEHGDIYAVDGGRVCEALPARAATNRFSWGSTARSRSTGA